MLDSELQDIVRAVRGIVPDRQAARDAAEGGPAFCNGTWDAFVGLGLAGATLPEVLGGAAIGLTGECAIIETLAENVAAIPVITTLLAGRILAQPVGEHGIALARSLADGRRVAPLLSAGGGTAIDVQFSADGGRISGIVTDAVEVAEAEVLLVPTGRGWCAIDASGTEFQSVAIPTIDPTRPLATVAFKDAAATHVSDVDLDGLLRLANIYAAAESVGTAAVALELGRVYALERRQFGELIGRFQAIKHKLTNALVALEGARSALHAAINTSRDGIPDASATHMVQAVASSAAVSIVLDMIQLHGAIGNSWEHDLHLLLRRAKYLQSLWGTAGYHHDRLSTLLLEEQGANGTGRSWESDLTLDDEDRAFLTEFRAWLEEHAPRERVKEIRTGGQGVRQRWQAELADGGWVGIHWPKAHGGRGASFVEQVLYHSELAARGFPGLVGNRGLSLIGPTLIAHGTGRQRERFLEATRRADILWASGLSEPNAGSDLASLRTRGVVEGDALVINGQKTWTSGADFADMLFALVRTGPVVPKHEGITCVMIPMDLPGITLRPIRRIHGDPEFYEVFLDNVRVPLDNIIGDIGNGWRVARTSLSFEHMTNFLGTQLRNAFLVNRLLDQYRSIADNTSCRDPGLRTRVTQAWINTQLLRLHGLRSIAKVSETGEPGAEGSILKLFGQEEEQRLFELALDLKGSGALSATREIRNFLSARAATVGGGTSEVHRNKIAERVLGMPRDPWADD